MCGPYTVFMNVILHFRKPRTVLAWGQKDGFACLWAEANSVLADACAWVNVREVSRVFLSVFCFFSPCPYFQVERSCWVSIQASTSFKFKLKSKKAMWQISVFFVVVFFVFFFSSFFFSIAHRNTQKSKKQQFSTVMKELPSTVNHFLQNTVS